jgi:hypothetical protein
MSEVQTTKSISAIEVPPDLLRNKELPPTPSQKIKELELEKKSLRDENRTLRIQVDIQAHQIAKLNSIFYEGVSS